MEWCKPSLEGSEMVKEILKALGEFSQGFCFMQTGLEVVFPVD